MIRYIKIENKYISEMFSKFLINEKDREKNVCPYCHIKFRSIEKHAKKCKENPKNKVFEEYQQIRKNLQSRFILEKQFRF